MVERVESGLVSASEEDLQILNRCHLRFYQEYGLLRCILCEHLSGEASSSSANVHPGVMNQNFREHLRVAHSVTILSSDATHILNKFWIPGNRYFQPTRLVLPALDFLPVVAGYGCEECLYYTKNKKTILAHYRKKHAGLVMPEIDSLTCSLQSLAPEPIRRYFAVNAVVRPANPSPTTQHSSLATTLIQTWNRKLEEPVTIASQVPRLLSNLCWTSNIFGEYREYLLACPNVEADDPVAFANLYCLDEFFASAIDNIEEVDYNIRLKLKEEARGFRPLQEKSSIIRYTSVMARFVWFSVKCHLLEEQSPVILEKPIKASLNVFQQRLLRPQEKDDDRQWKEALVDFLFKVYFSRPPSFSCSHLVPAFIRLGCTDPDGNARSIDDITHTCAIVFYPIPLFGLF